MRTMMFIGAMVAASAALAGEFEPTAWLRQTYDLYHRAEKDGSLVKDSASDRVLPHASKALAALLKRDKACEAKGQICAIDWDFIVNGQDWQLGAVKVGALQASGDRATVSVDFFNMKTATTVVYHLIKAEGEWRIDDIEDRRKGEKPVSVSKILREFKDY